MEGLYEERRIGLDELLNKMDMIMQGQVSQSMQIDSLEKKFSSVEDKLDETKEVTMKMKNIFLGNGVKGKVKEFEENDERLSNDIDKLKKVIYKTIGACAILIPLLSLMFKFIFDKVFGG